MKDKKFIRADSSTLKGEIVTVISEIGGAITFKVIVPIKRRPEDKGLVDSIHKKQFNLFYKPFHTTNTIGGKLL